jgi:[protein-PII] uridylyltransferase
VRRLGNVDRLLLGAWLTEVFEDDPDPVASARATLERLVLPDDERRAVLDLISDRDLLWSAAHQPGALSEDAVIPLAAHLDTPERARALYALSALRSEGRERWELARLATLHDLVQTVLADDDLSGGEGRHLTELRKLEVSELLQGNAGALERVATAPRAFLLRQPAAALAREARLLDPPPRADEARVNVTAADEGGWWIEICTRDRPGLLATITSVLADASLEVDDALLATWPDGVVLDAFRMSGGLRPDDDALRAAMEAGASLALQAEPLPDAEIEFDNAASPWHTVCEVRASDRPRLLHSLATAFAAAGVDVRAAKVSADDGLVIDRFEVVDRDGAKLSTDSQNRLRSLIPTGVLVRRRRFGRRLVVRAVTPRG